MYKAFKYRLYPNKQQEELIAKHIGCSRWVYNYGLNRKITSYQQDKKGISRFDIQKELPILKKKEETKWLTEVNSLTLQSSLEHLDQAFTKFFRDKKGFPKFKSKHNGNQSFSVVQNTKVDFENNKVSLPKFKDSIKCIFSREFEGVIKTSTVSRTTTGKYFISILVDVPKELPLKKPIDESQAIGIDLGIKSFAMLSNGIEIDNPKHLRKSLRKLKRLQRKASKKKKGSNNRKKANRKVGLLYEKVTNQRKDFLHKTTHHLITTYDTICLETLKVSNMIKNHKLALSLSDVSIGKFNDFIDYKSEWYGSNVLRIGQFEPSSKMCSCGVINKELKLSDRKWTCSSCKTTHNRDLLASNNIKRFAFVKNKTTDGTSGSQACGELNSLPKVSRSSKKQEASIPLG